MAKVKAKVLNAVVDGKTKGEIVTIEEKSAKHLESINYVEIVGKASNQKAADDDKKEGSDDK